MDGTFLGYAAVMLVLAPGARWLWLMLRVRIPRDRTAYVTASVAAAVVGLVALACSPSFGGALSAVVAIVSGVAFVVLCAASTQARTTPRIAVGGPVLSFHATDDAGEPFDLDSLRGVPFLLKFFRGHWCPYCLAELRRWKEMTPELEARGIRIVTVCADNAEQIRKGRHRHGLDAIMLADPDLAITDRYNLRNPKSFAPKPGLVIPLPIPTTVLVDADGIVRWIDQSTDYMQRSEPARVMEAIRSSLGDQRAAPPAKHDALLRERDAHATSPLAGACAGPAT